MWGVRHGFPQPRRVSSGHRRYSEADVARVRAVIRAREGGLSLQAAIELAHDAGDEQPPSVYASLRSRFPALQPQLLPKRAMVWMSHAIEDECLARAERPLLFGCFQRERFYRESERRWRELARTAERAVVSPTSRAPGDQRPGRSRSRSHRQIRSPASGRSCASRRASARAWRAGGGREMTATAACACSRRRGWSRHRRAPGRAGRLRLTSAAMPICARTCTNGSTPPRSPGSTSFARRFRSAPGWCGTPPTPSDSIPASRSAASQ